MESEQERILRGSKELDEFINRYGLNPKLRQFWKELRYTWPDKESSSASKDGAVEDEQERARRVSEELDKFMGRNALIPQLRQFWKNELRYTWPKGSSSASKDREDEHKR